MFKIIGVFAIISVLAILAGESQAFLTVQSGYDSLHNGVVDVMGMSTQWLTSSREMVCRGGTK